MLGSNRKPKKKPHDRALAAKRRHRVLAAISADKMDRVRCDWCLQFSHATEEHEPCEMELCDACFPSHTCTPLFLFDPSRFAKTAPFFQTQDTIFTKKFCWKSRR